MQHDNNSSHQDNKTPQWQPHKDWRTWLGLALMLLAITMYVLSLDDSVVPQIVGK